jgi:hypothetical protein
MYFVRVVYNGTTLRLEGCTEQGLVPLPLFRLLLAKRISVDYAGECSGGSGGCGSGGAGGVNTVAWPSLSVLSPSLSAASLGRVGIRGERVSPKSILGAALLGERGREGAQPSPQLLK